MTTTPILDEKLLRMYVLSNSRDSPLTRISFLFIRSFLCFLFLLTAHDGGGVEQQFQVHGLRRL